MNLDFILSHCCMDGPTQLEKVEVHCEDAILDETITLEVLKSSIKRLHTYKQSSRYWLYYTCPIVFKAFHNQLIQYTVSLFTSIFKQSDYPIEWAMDIVKQNT